MEKKSLSPWSCRRALGSCAERTRLDLMTASWSLSLGGWPLPAALHKPTQINVGAGCCRQAGGFELRAQTDLVKAVKNRLSHHTHEDERCVWKKKTSLNGNWFLIYRVDSWRQTSFQHTSELTTAFLTFHSGMFTQSHQRENLCAVLASECTFLSKDLGISQLRIKYIQKNSKLNSYFQKTTAALHKWLDWDQRVPSKRHTALASLS